MTENGLLYDALDIGCLKARLQGESGECGKKFGKTVGSHVTFATALVNRAETGESDGMVWVLLEHSRN